MEITSLALNNFAPEEFFGGGEGGGQIGNDEYTSKNSKNVNFDCIMKAFFDERNNLPQHKWFTNANECFQRTAEMSLEIAKGLVNVRKVNVFISDIRFAK